MSFLAEAFAQVCNEAKGAEGCYISLVVHRPFYGGPEEGGWWGSDTEVVAYQHFATREAAEIAAEQVRKLAYELEQESQREFGKQCLREMEWLDRKGLEADWLPEPDGEETFSVTISETIPENSHGCRHYE